MTEPAPGAGSDPTMLLTKATRVDGGWEISGRKWFATGADGSAFAIAMVVTDPSVPTHKGATMFLVPIDAPGFEIVRVLDTIDAVSPGGHAVVD